LALRQGLGRDFAFGLLRRWRCQSSTTGARPGEVPLQAPLAARLGAAGIDVGW